MGMGTKKLMSLDIIVWKQSQTIQFVKNSSYFNLLNNVDTYSG